MERSGGAQYYPILAIGMMLLGWLRLGYKLAWLSELLRWMICVSLFFMICVLLSIIAQAKDPMTLEF